MLYTCTLETMRLPSSFIVLPAAAALLLGYSSSWASAFLVPATSNSVQQRRGAVPMRMSVSVAAASGQGGTLRERLQASFPDLHVPNEFLAAVRPSDSSQGGSGHHRQQEADSERQLLRARAFASMAPRVLVSRGLDTIADEFTFFSPSTGTLDRSEYLGLVSIMERAMPDLRLQSAAFQVVGPEGAVAFVSRARGTFTGTLELGDAAVAGTGARYQGEPELNVVTFNEEGQLQSYSTGLVLHPSDMDLDTDADPELAALLSGASETASGAGGADEVAEELADLQRRLESQEQKLSTTPEGTAAHEKISADVAATRGRIAGFQREGALIRSAGGQGGLGGVLFALGVTYANAPTAEDLGLNVWEGLDEVTLELDLETMPTECRTVLGELQQQQQSSSSG